MKNLFLVLVTMASSIGAFAQWNLDKGHSSVNFSVAHMNVSHTTGSFDEFTVMVDAPNDDFSKAAISFTADVKSINTGSEGRDGHLQQADFFDAANHPTISFEGKSFTKVKGNKYKLKGELTIKGHTEMVEMEVDYNGILAKDPFGMSRTGFTIKGEIDRTKYGLNYNADLPDGFGKAIGEQVNIYVNIELVKKPK